MSRHHLSNQLLHISFNKENLSVPSRKGIICPDVLRIHEIHKQAKKRTLTYHENKILKVRKFMLKLIRKQHF